MLKMNEGDWVKYKWGNGQELGEIVRMQHDGKVGYLACGRWIESVNVIEVRNPIPHEGGEA